MFLPSGILFWLLAALGSRVRADKPEPHETDPKLYETIHQVNELLWQVVEHEVNMLKLPEGSRVLDIGTGFGQPAATIAKQLPTLKVTVADKQQAMIDRARKNLKDLPNIEGYHVVGMDNLSMFEEESFDVITGVHMLQDVEDVDVSLAEIGRIMKEGATGIFAVWKQLPFYELSKESMEETYTKNGGIGVDAPALASNPMALSPTDHNTKGSIEEHVKTSGMRILHKRELNKPFHFGTMEKNCEATAVLTKRALVKMAELTGKKETDLWTDFCDILRRKMEEHRFLWHAGAMKDDDWKLGDGVADVYTFKKGGEHEEL